MYARDYRQLARDSLAGNWGISILAALIAVLFGAHLVMGGFSISIDDEVLQKLLDRMPESIYDLIMGLLVLWASVSSLVSMAQLIFGGPIQLGYCTFLLHQQDRTEHLSVHTLFSKFDRFVEGFILKLLTALLIALWSLLLFIPGLIKGYSYALAPFILAENPGMRPNDAITESRRLMDGHKWELFCLDISFIGWSLLSALTLGVGLLFLNPYANAARAAFYRKLCPNNTQGHTTVEYL